MNKSTYSHTSFFLRGIIALAIFGFVFHSSVFAQVPSETTTAMVTSATKEVATPTDILLELAGSIGQAASAQRLIDFKLKNDPDSRPRYYGIVDFDQPSSSKRFYVIDTVEKKVDAYYVSHGRGSEGAKDDGIAEVFSNGVGSNSSSLGIYRTLNEYNGHNGRSLRLEGLEPTNSNVLARAVVIHTSQYVSDAFIAKTGRIGRSEGCFAVEKAVGDTLVNELKDGAYIIASKN